jgi:uncharacterized protein YfeS
MQEDFFWSTIEESGPFGSDDGWEAGQHFYEWRQTYKSASPLVGLKELIERWQYPFFDWNELDPEKISDYIAAAPEPDDDSIMQQMEMLKSAFGNAPGNPMQGLDEEQLKEIFSASAQRMNDLTLLGQDNAIIATGFAQLALEGKIDSDLKAVTKNAITRQLLPVLLDRYDEEYRQVRKEQLTKMLDAVEKTGS